MHPVVIVETEDIVRDAVADVLRDAWIEVIALTDGWDIFWLSEKTVLLPPSLLVANINLGVRLDGFKVAAAAQHRWPRLPVICISSHPVKYQPLHCDPCDWFRMELFTPTAFVEAVQRLIVTNRKDKSHHDYREKIPC
jgi:DNA-binding NtrC family response regulator